MLATDMQQTWRGNVRADAQAAVLFAQSSYAKADFDGVTKSKAVA